MKRLALIMLLPLAGCATQQVSPPEPDFVSVRPVVAAPPPIENGSIYRTGYGMSLFSDVSAKRVGDIITVVLEERTNASKSNSASTKKGSSVDIPSPTILGDLFKYRGKEILNNEIESDREFSGSGDASQSNTLNGRVTVSVADVLANGYLVVQGEKRLSLSQGSEHIRFSGIVRPADIRSDNTVLSTSVANAQIIYGSTGSLADASKPGWLTRVFNSRFWPF